MGVRTIGGMTPVVIARGLDFPEGPVWHEGGLYFSDISNNRILRLDATGRGAVFRQPSNYSNGLAVDARGRLLAVELGDPVAKTPPRVTRTDLVTGVTETLVERIDGRALRGPNDITLDGQGRIYFTDTRRANLLKNWAPGDTDRTNPASVLPHRPRRRDLPGRG